MSHRAQKAAGKGPRVNGRKPAREARLYKQHTAVWTPDGSGKVVGVSMRRNTNGGPGARQYVVRLEDGRIRHFPTSQTREVEGLHRKESAGG